MALLFSSIELCPSPRCKGDINMCPNTLQAHEEKKSKALQLKILRFFIKKVPPMREKIFCKC